MIIRTTREQDKAISKWYKPHVAAHHSEGCDGPPGYTLMLSLGELKVYGVSGCVVYGEDKLEIGDVEVTDE
jgi:hypothetical protein